MFERFFRNSHKNDDAEAPYEYATAKVADLTDEELEECSALFSSYYGKYNEEGKNPGKPIKMKTSYYKNFYCKPNFYVALAKDDNKLIGHAFYLRKDYAEFGKMTWVIQLVVADQYRRKGVASTLLRSIWGFSDDYAWGLATTNPCTIKALESATFRKFKPKVVQKNLKAIKMIQADIPFANNKELHVSNSTSQINTEFYVDNSQYTKDNSLTKGYGELRNGHEWLAFTFRNQGVDEEKYKKNFKKMIQFSDMKLKEAYSRMDMKKHPWTKGTDNEVNFIMTFGSNEAVLDLGCGFGRHSIGLALQGAKVTAIDFSENIIRLAEQDEKYTEEIKKRCKFITQDVRYYSSPERFNKVICMYDVIGSYPEENDNRKILQTAYKHLMEGGFFILSVMNMEYTENVALPTNCGDIESDIRYLRQLPPSATMQSSGNIFEPKYLAIDKSKGLVYRKEQFSSDGLSAEYVICDKRYRMNEICKMVEDEGFTVVEKRYVRSGHFDIKSSSRDAKEICVVAKKVKK